MAPGIFEALAIKVGAATAKAVLQTWLNDTPAAASVAGDISDLIGKSVSDFRDQRRLKRQFERLADTVAEKLEPFFASELGGIDSSERFAAMDAVCATLAATHISGAAIVSAHVDPLRLERMLRENDQDRVRVAGLGEPGAALYDFTLRECCNYIVEAHIGLPSFELALARGLLESDSQIIDKLEEILNKLPASANPDLLESRPLHSGFEIQYLRDLARSQDQLELYGLNVAGASKRYNLSVAYISLTSSSPSKADKGLGQGIDDELQSVPVEKALSKSSRLLVRGEAGSGKTTLLKWITVRAARSEFEHDLQQWNGRVPFLLELRRWADSQPPQPQEFLTFAAPNVVGRMPQDYVHQVCEAGQALILIDGVDEVPIQNRSQIREWLEGLLQSFPDCTFIITSRPPAINEDWLSMPGFAVSDLQSMDLGDIRAFVTHWHMAAAAQEDYQKANAIIAMADQMHLLIRDTPALRRLATSPLLCAMLCALHRDRGSRLPKNRVELYRIAVETLLVTRDAERRVLLPGFEGLLQAEQEAILQDFALWLIDNGYSDAALDQFSRTVEQKLAVLHNVKASSAQVVTYLLERSAMLREPVAGKVDFIHRTFQEYFAARELIDHESVGKLVNNAHLDQWREVVVLACGHANSRLREELITGLINRGDREAPYQHRLHLLAVASLETATQLPPELQAKVALRLRRLLPPLNMTDASAVASARELAVPLLSYTNRRATTQAACVRALARIGTTEALNQLAGYAPDRRVTVARELIRAWSSFDTAEYVDKVLATSRLENGSITIKDPALVEYIPRLRHARDVMCEFRGRLTNFDVLAPAGRRLQGLDASNNYFVRDLQTLARHPDLDWLILRFCTNLISLAGLHEVRVHWLDLTGCSNLRALDGIASHPTLQTLYLDETSVSDLTPLVGATALNRLDLDGTPEISLRAIQEMVSLRYLSLIRSKVTDLGPLASSHIVDLSIDNVSAGTLATLPTIPNLTTLRFGPAPSDILNQLQPQPSTNELNFIARRDQADVAFLCAFRSVRRLRIYNGRPSDFSTLLELPHLEYLYADLRTVEDYRPFIEHPSLQRISTPYSVSAEVQEMLKKCGYERRGYSSIFTRQK